MAGWLIVWCRNDNGINGGVWKRALRAAGRYGEKVSDFICNTVAMATWRREKGEFPYSGTGHPITDGHVAWVGQCLEDSGETTLDAIQLLSEPSPSHDAVAALNGPFAAAVFHENQKSITLWTDRYRHYPIYLYRNGNIAVAGTEMRCLLPWVSSPKVNREAVDLMLRCGELIDRMTLIEGVEVLPGGTCYHDVNGVQTEQPYWKFQFCPDHSLGWNECVEQLSDRLTAASQRIEATCPKLGITLSGGLDSRLILGLCRHPEHIPSFTWGLPGCRDIQCAAAFAKKVDSPHQIRHWQPSAFVPLWREGVDRTGGAAGIHEMFMLPFVTLLSEHCDVVLNGLAGDVLLGGNFLKHSWMREKNLAALAGTVWRWRVTSEQDEWADQLLNGSSRSGSGRERWVASICQKNDSPPIDCVNGWLFENRIFRYTNCGTMLLRGGVESHAPFFDRDFMDFMLKIPFEYKLKHRLYLKVLNRACPPAGKVRWQRTYFPPAWGFWPNLGAMAFHRFLKRTMSSLGVNPFPSLIPVDVANWFRREWKQETEEFLFDEQTLSRGIFDSEGLKKLWTAHQQGADFSRQLGVLVTVELFMRMAANGELQERENLNG